MSFFDDLTKNFGDLFGEGSPTIITSMQKQVLRTAEQLYIERGRDNGKIVDPAVCLLDAETFWKIALKGVKASGDWVASPTKPISDADANEIRVMCTMLEKQMLNIQAAGLLRSRINGLLDALGYPKGT